MLLELSYPFGPEEPKWPTNPNDSVVLDLSTSRGDICNTSTICHHMHNGTHVDAPRHFDPNGRTIDQIPAEDFLYEHPLLLHIPKGKSGRVLVEDLKRRTSCLSTPVMRICARRSQSGLSMISHASARQPQSICARRSQSSRQLPWTS